MLARIGLRQRQRIVTCSCLHTCVMNVSVAGAVDDAKAAKKAAKKLAKEAKRAKRQGLDPTLGQKPCSQCKRGRDLLVRLLSQTCDNTYTNCLPSWPNEFFRDLHTITLDICLSLIYCACSCRCQVDSTGTWHMVCGKCWLQVSGGVVDGDNQHPYYRYYL
jgi:hypothetical protein